MVNGAGQRKASAAGAAERLPVAHCSSPSYMFKHILHIRKGLVRGGCCGGTFVLGIREEVLHGHEAALVGRRPRRRQHQPQRQAVAQLRAAGQPRQPLRLEAGCKCS